MDFDGRFYRLHHARLDTEPYDGRFPQIWIGGERAADARHRRPLRRRLVAGGAWTPEDYADKLAAVRDSAEAAGRDPMAITPCFIQVCLIGEDDDALAEILRGAAGQGVPAAGVRRGAAPLRLRTSDGRRAGAASRTSIPATLTRERIVDFLDRVEPEAILAVVPARHAATGRAHRSRLTSTPACGCRRSWITAAMAGLKFARASAANVREAEDELLRLCGDVTMTWAQL